MELVNNRFRIIKKLKQNRLVSSYLVTDILDDYREIQLNILNTEFLPNALLEYYFNEFILLSNIKNDNVVKDYNFNIVSFVDNKKQHVEQFLYTCEYFENEVDIFKLTQKMKMSEILDIFALICRGVNYLHLTGHIYGEINFNNILVGINNGEINLKLKDLATVELEKYIFKTDKADDTYFKSPKLHAGEKPSRDSDIYALGVILVSMLRKKAGTQFDVITEITKIKEYLSNEENSKDSDYSFLKNITPIIEKMLSIQMNYPYSYLADLFEEINSTFKTNYSIYDKEEIEKLHFQTKIIGRKNEIKKIMQAYDYMIKYKPVKKLFVIHGESGSGKTRFLEELKYLLELKRANIYSSFSLSDQSDSSNKMWVDILRRLIAEADPETIEKYESELMKFFPELMDRKNVLPTEYLNRDNTKYRLLNRIAGFISDTIKSKPAVIIIDNIHLANEFTLDTFSYLNNEIVKNKNVIIIFSYKDGEGFNNKKFMEFISSIRVKWEAEDINMKDLATQETALMVQSMLSMPNTPINLAERIYSQSYGNPLFVSEIIKNLYSRKIIYIDNKTGRWFSDYDSNSSYKYLPIPNSMEQAILSQIKGSDELGHEILEIISVFSNSVSAQDICYFINLDIKHIDKAVNELVARGIICKKIGDKGFVYDINNKILKDIVYDKISFEEKIEKHKLASAILERDYDATIGGNVDELIYHLEKAGAKEKVRKYSIESARRMELLKNRRAEIKNLEKAVSTFEEENTSEKIELLLKIGELYFNDGDILKSLECFNMSNIIAEELKDSKYIVDSNIKLANVYLEKSDKANVLECIKSIKHILKDYDYKKGSLESRLIEIKINFKDYIYDSVVESLMDIIDGCGEEFAIIKGESFTILGNEYMRIGKPEEAIEYYNRAIKCFEKTSITREMLYALNNIGVIYADFYQDEEIALKYYLRVKDLSEEYSYYSSLALALTNIAEIYFTRFDYETAINYYKQALDMSIKTGSESAVFYCYNVLSRVSLELRSYAEAYNYHILSKKELEAHPEQGRDIGEHYRCSAELYYAFGDFEESEKYIKNGIAFYGNEDSLINLFSTIHLQYINIRSRELENYNDCTDIILSTSQKFVTSENRIKVLCTAAVLLYENGDEENASRLLFEADKSVIGPISDVVNVIHLYAKGLLGRDNDRLKVLLRALNIAKRIKNKEFIKSISTSIGDYYFSSHNYFYAANYYIEAWEIIKEIITQIPDEFKLKFVNIHNMIKPFRRIEYIKKMFINPSTKFWRAENIDKDQCILASPEEIDELVTIDEVGEFLASKDFIESIRKLYMSFLPKGVLTEKDIMSNIGNNTIKNIELVIKYLAGITLATKGIVAVEGSQHELSVISSIDDKLDIPVNRYIFERVKATMEPLLIVEKTNKHELDSNQLPEDVKACLCIPIIARDSSPDFTSDNDKYRGGNSRQNISGYLYFESDRILNNFNQDGLKKCIELTGFLNLLIEKHQLKLAASIDKLTGALTRKYLEDTLTDEMDKASAHGNSLSIILYDLDRFKSVNDRFGHQTGDEVLKKVSRIVKENIGRNDSLGRYGGEEFIIILPDTELDDAILVAEELRKKIQNEKILGDKADITVSMGIASYPIQGQWKQEIIEKADQALYVAKENGRNRCQAWDSKFSKKVKGTNKLSGIITGNAVQDSRNVLVLVEIIELINKSIGKKEKIYSLLGRIIEIVEAQYGMLVEVNKGEIVNQYTRKSFDEEWAVAVNYNKNAVDTVIKNKQGLYMIDWDDAGSYDLITGIPDWYSILVVPIVIENETRGVIYLSASTRVKEFGFDELNFVNVLSDLAATIL